MGEHGCDRGGAIGAANRPSQVSHQRVADRSGRPAACADGRWFAPVHTIFDGTSEIQRMIIGRAVIGLDVR